LIQTKDCEKRRRVRGFVDNAGSCRTSGLRTLPPPVLLRPTLSARFQRAQNVNNGGYSRKNLRTTLRWSEAEILSLGLVLSKPPHFALLVRFNKSLMLSLFSYRRPQHFEELSRGSERVWERTATLRSQRCSSRSMRNTLRFRNGLISAPQSSVTATSRLLHTR
jgi:hypothetical protein